MYDTDALYHKNKTYISKFCPLKSNNQNRSNDHPKELLFLKEMADFRSKAESVQDEPAKALYTESKEPMKITSVRSKRMRSY